MKIGNNSRSLLLALVACAMSMAAAAPLRAQVSLYTVVDLAQRNSSVVKLADADVRKAAAALEESRDGFIPALTFGSGLPAFPEIGYTGSLPSIYRANMDSLVFSMPQIRSIQAARSGLKAARLNLKDAQEQVAFEASTAYIELDAVDSELKAAREQGNYASHLVEIEEQRSEAGVDSLGDLLQAKLTAAQLNLKLLHLEARAGNLVKQLATLTGLPVNSVAPDHETIPEIPAVRADLVPIVTLAVESARQQAQSKERIAKGDEEHAWLPEFSFGAQYNRNTTLLNSVNSYYAKPLPATNFSSGFSIELPLFDIGRRSKAKGSAADALRANVEAEQAQRQNELQIAELTGNLRELGALAEISSLKQQIAAEQLQTVLAQLELGNGAGSGPGAAPQLSPKAEQLARIDERQKLLDSLDAGFDLSKARLSLLRALGHMGDWLHELHAK